MLAGLCVLLLMTSCAAWKLHTLSEGVCRVIQQGENPMQTATTTVTNTDGVSITITTTKNQDESDADWMARHLASVNTARES